MEIPDNQTANDSCSINDTFRYAEGKADFQISTLGYIVLEVFLGVFIGTGNMLVLLAVRKFQELRTSINIFVVSLAITDLSVAFVALPLHIAIWVFPYLKSVFFVCIMRYSVLIFSSGASAAMLIIISVDRFLAIEKPFVYGRLASTGRAKILSAGVWTFTLIFGSLPLLGWNHFSSCGYCRFTHVLPHIYISVIVVVTVVSTVFISILNTRIFITANSISADIQRQNASVTGQNAANQDLVKNKKAAKALVLVCGAFTVCLLPFALFTLWEINALDMASRREYDIIRIGTTFIAFINSGLNPVIYHRRIPEFNAAFRKLLRLSPKVSGSVG